MVDLGCTDGEPVAGAVDDRPQHGSLLLQRVHGRQVQLDGERRHMHRNHLPERRERSPRRGGGGALSTYATCWRTTSTVMPLADSRRAAFPCVSSASAMSR